MGAALGIPPVPVTLHPTQAAPRAHRPRPGGGAPAGPTARGERVTLSDEAREASRALPPVPTSGVRWYRAVRASPAPAAVPRNPGRPIHTAVATYLAQLPAVAQARAA